MEREILKVVYGEDENGRYRMNINMDGTPNEVFEGIIAMIVQVSAVVVESMQITQEELIKVASNLAIETLAEMKKNISSYEKTEEIVEWEKE